MVRLSVQVFLSL